VKQLVILLFSASLALGLAGCKNETPKTAEQQPAAQAAAPGSPETAAPTAMGQSGTVVETMDAGGYTYVLVDTGFAKLWAAAPKFDVKVGDPVAVPQGMAMKDYHSNTLNRDFSMVYFVDSILVGGSAAAMTTPAPMSADLPGATPGSVGAPKVVATDVDLSGIKVAEGGKTVQQVYEDPAGLSGKSVKIRAKVVKYNADIMGKNWLHIQDGTGADGTNDLTVTTASAAKVGDTVLVDGVLVTDKDFGYGYKYAVLIEDAKVTVE
jgi:hypothetical protein